MCEHRHRTERWSCTFSTEKTQIIILYRDNTWRLLTPSDWAGNNLNCTKKEADFAFRPLCSFFEETYPGNTSTLERRLGSRRWRKIQWRLTRKTAPFFPCVFFQAKVATWRPPRPPPVCSVVYVIVLLLGRWRVSAGSFCFIQDSCFSSPRWGSINLHRRAQGSNTEWLFIRGGLAHWNKEVSLHPWVFWNRTLLLENTSDFTFKLARAAASRPEHEKHPQVPDSQWESQSWWMFSLPIAY